MPSYRPFVVRIDQPVDGAYPLSADFQGLQARADIPVAVLRQCLVDAANISGPDAARKHLGSRLFTALFTGDVLRLFETANNWLGPAERLRIILAQPLPEPLSQLPWELVFDAQGEPRSLASSPNTPLVRHAPTDALPHAPPGRGALRVLAITAFASGVLPSPSPVAALSHGLPPRDTLRVLASQLDRSGLRDAARRLSKGRRYDVTLLENATCDALREKLAAAGRADAPYHIIHFFGQATESGELLMSSAAASLADAANRLEPLSPSQFAELVVSDTVTLLAVTLCQAGAAADVIRCIAEEATRRGVPAVVGMQVPQLDAAVVDFSREFYRALAAGEPIELALAYGRRMVRQLHGSNRSLDLPAVYMAHTGGLTLPSLERVHIVPRAWRLASWALATAFAVVGTTSGILDLPSFPQMLRARAPVIRCVWPNPMDGNKLTIAFQPLTVVDETGRTVASADGHAVAEFLYQRLVPALADLNLDVPHEIRSPSLACALPGRTAEDRARAAADHAQRIGADILVYGVITDTQKSDRMALAFNVDYRGYDNADEVAGPYALGGSLPVTLPFDAQELLVIEHPPHLVRMNVLAELVVGLSYLRADNPEKALTYLRMAESDPHWPAVDGKEFAYLLEGHALMRQASVTGIADTIAGSLNAYDAALAIKPEYIRAQLGRAGALAMLSVAERGEDGRRRLDRPRLAEAEASYLSVLNGAANLSAAEMSTARAGLGYVYLTSALYGQIADFERARSELVRVTGAYEAGNRDIAQNAGLAYGYLGLLARQRGDITAAVSYYNQAVDLVAPVSRALYLFRLSELACQQGDHVSAVEFNARAADEARLYGRAAEVDDYTRRLIALKSSSCP